MEIAQHGTKRPLNDVDKNDDDDDESVQMAEYREKAPAQPAALIAATANSTAAVPGAAPVAFNPEVQMMAMMRKVMESIRVFQKSVREEQ